MGPSLVDILTIRIIPAFDGIMWMAWPQMQDLVFSKDAALVPHKGYIFEELGACNDFGPPFTNSRNYLSPCNATVAKGLMLSSEHIILAI